MNREDDLELLVQKTYLYEAQLSGIRCTGCTKKISESVGAMPHVKSVNINVIGEKGLFLLESQDILGDIQQKIKDIGFNVLNGFHEIVFKQDSSDTTRSIHFEFTVLPNILHFSSELEKAFPGILSVSINPPNIVAVKYNSKAVKGRQICDFILSNYSDTAKPFNLYAEGFKKQEIHGESTRLREVILALIVCGLFIIATIILPRFNFFDSAQIYPMKFGVFSIYVILLFILMIFSIVYFGRQPIYRASVNFWKYHLLNMETLVALGSVSAFIMSLFLIGIYYHQINADDMDSQSSMDMMNSSSSSSLSSHGSDESERRHMTEEVVHMLETASLILAIITLGKYLESKSKQSIISMSDKLFPEEQLLANINVDFIEIKNKKFEIDLTKQYNVSYLDKDDMIQVTAPFKLLTDAIVVNIPKDTTLKAVDQVCFGWDDAQEIHVGQTLKSGADIKEGTAILQITNTIEDSILFNISKQLDIATTNSESTQTGLSALFKTFSEHFVKFIILTAVISFLVWIIIIAADGFYVSEYCKWCFPIERFISVLVASCPCALGLAIPSVIVVTLNMAMKNSILIKKNSVFEKIQKINVIIFDKTGTLFTKTEKISGFQSYISQRFNDSQLWQIIQFMEKGNKHPLAELLYKESISRGCNTFTSDFKMMSPPEFNGKTGLAGILFDTKRKNEKLDVLLGNQKLLTAEAIQVSPAIEEQLNGYLKSGFTVILLAINKQLAASILIDNSNNLRPEARDVVKYLQENLKKEVYILSGDHKDTVLEVGKYLNIPEKNLIGECEASMKKGLIKRLREVEKKEVMMVGDGLNDILSLEEASLGVSINAKSELNLIASDIVILQENLWNIVFIFDLLHAARVFIYINLAWAFLYNIVMIPMAAGVFEEIGLHISPLISSASMSGSSVIVVLFSSLLRFFKFNRESLQLDSSKNQQQPVVMFNKNTRHNKQETLTTHAFESEGLTAS